MNQQLLFSETPKPPQATPAKYSVFLAVFPDSSTAHHISELAMGIREKHGLHGRVRPLSHLHVSLYFLGGCPDVSEKVIHFVGQICETVAASIPAFEARFDEAISFRGGLGKRPLVLVNYGDGNAKLMRLHQALDAAFSKYRRHSGGNLKFNPHITLLYDRQGIQEQPINPISWMVDEIVLVCSEVGATKYERLGSWKLGG
jgi:2'-5' RNA ligase